MPNRRAAYPSPVASRQSPSETSPGETARYRVGEEIARGGMAIIFRAFDRVGQREVAYKRLTFERDDDKARRTGLFQREYETLVQLAHPNIPRAFDYGVDHTGPFYTLELLSGQDLLDTEPTDLRQTCLVLRDVASALSLIHSRGWVHRDITPSNVRVLESGRAKLLDFGGATSFGRATEIVGTPAFTAPESLTGEPLDARTDLYAFGALAYWALTRKLAIHATTLDELAGALQLPIPPPSKYAPGLPDALDALVLSLLQHEPRSRPESAAEVMERLTTLADLEPESVARQVAYSYLAHPPLVGRSETLDAITDRVSGATRGGGGSVLVQSSAGLGRTAMLRRLGTIAQIRGALVLRANGGAQFGPLALVKTLARTLVAMYPELTERAHDTASRSSSSIDEEPTSRLRHAPSPELFAMLESYFTRLAVKTPIVLLVDDVHRADSESLGFLAALAWRATTESLAILVVASEQSGPSQGLTHEKFRGLSQRYSLSPLTNEQVGLLVTKTLGRVPNARRLAKWLYTETAGNPSACIDVLRVLMRRGVLRYSSGAFVLPPEIALGPGSSVRNEALLARLDGLPESAIRIAEVLALRDGALDLAQLAIITARETKSLVLDLETLRERALVTEFDEHYALAGTWLASVLHETMSSDERARLHLAIADVHRGSGADLDSQMIAAAHLFDAEREDEAADLVLRLCNDDQFPVDLSSRHVDVLERALRVQRARGLPETFCAGPLSRLAIAGFYGDVGPQTPYVQPALAALSELCGITLARRLSPYVGRKLAIYIGFGVALVRSLAVRRLHPLRMRFRLAMRSLLGTAVAAIGAAACAFDAEQARKVLEFLEPLAPFPIGHPIGASREFCIATGAVSSGELDRARAHFTRLEERLREPIRNLKDDVRLHMRLGSLTGAAQVAAQQVGEGALPNADVLAKGHPFFTSHAEAARMVHYAARGELQRATQHLERAERLELRGGLSWSSNALSAVRLLPYYALLGYTAGLHSLASDLSRMSRHVPTLAVYPEIAYAMIELIRERPKPAAERLERILDAATNLSRPELYEPVLARALIESGRAEHARARLHAVLERLEARRDTPTFAHQALRIELAIAEAVTGDTESAVRRVDACLADAAYSRYPFWRGLAHRACALIAIENREAALFEAHFDAMALCFAQTQSACVIQQTERLAARAVALGIRSVEHELPDTSAARSLELPPTLVTELVPK